MPANLEAGPLMPPVERLLALPDELLARIVLAMIGGIVRPACPGCGALAVVFAIYDDTKDPALWGCSNEACPKWPAPSGFAVIPRREQGEPRGASWVQDGRGFLLLVAEGGRSLVAYDRGEIEPLDALPDPFTDPADAWELETRELCGWELSGLGFHRFRWADDVSVLARFGPWHPDRKRAAVLAVLHKYATYPSLAPLIRPLLERMEVAHANP